MKSKSILFDSEFSNSNKEESKNYAAIDLVDKKNKIAFQITSTRELEKVKHTLYQFLKKRRFTEIDTLYHYILTDKQQSYSQIAVDNYIKEVITELVNDKVLNHEEVENFIFDTKNQIIDKVFIYNELNRQNDINKIVAIEKYLKTQFDKIDFESDLKIYQANLRNAYFDVVMNDDKGLTLKDIYIEPSFKIHRSSFKKDDTRIQHNKHKDFLSVNEPYNIHEFVKDILNKNNSLDLKIIPNVFIILGYPGQGKTSFCKRFLYDFYSDESGIKKQVFWIKLRNIRQVEPLIFNPITVLLEEAKSIIEMEIDRFDFCKSILILDGLDELYMRENLKFDQIDKFCIELIRETEKHSDLQIILTSRYGYIDLDNFLTEKVIVLQLKELSISQQQHFVNKFNGVHTDAWLTESKLLAYHQSDDYTYICELISQPLLLYVIASMQQFKETHLNKAKVYSQLFDELLERRYSNSGQLENLKGISKEDLRELIQEIAFAVFQTGNEYINKTDLLKIESVKKYLSKLQNPNIQDTIKGIMISFYFQESKKQVVENEDISINFAIEFLHKSLQEYMTAEKILRTIKDAFLDKNQRKGNYIIDTWEEALEILYLIFSKQPLNNEIIGFINEIFENNELITLDEREIISERFALFLPQFIKRDFIHNFDCKIDVYGIEKSRNTFYGFWTIISNSKNWILDDVIKQRLSFYINSNLHHSGLVLTNQDLSYMSFQRGILSNFILNKAKLNNCDFTFSNLRNCQLAGANLSFSNLRHSNLSHADFSNAIITSVNLKNANIEGAKFDNVIIHNTDIQFIEFDESTSFSNTQFKNVKIDIDTFEALEKQFELDRADFKIINYNEPEIEQEYPDYYYEDMPYELDDIEEDKDNYKFIVD